MSPDPLFRVLLRLYPARTRDAFGRGMIAAWRADLAAVRGRGITATAVFWIVTIADAARFALVDRAGAVSIRGALTIDWRDAWRSLRSSPMVTTFCVVSLAFGIGGVTALFSILNSLVLKPLPVRDPGSLVLLQDGDWTNPVWEQLRARRAQFAAEAFAWSSDDFNVSDTATADVVKGLWASGEMFEALGVRAAAGRTLGPRDDVRGGGPDGPTAVISWAMWQRRYGGAPDVVGRRLSIDRVPFTIVGVTARGFLGPDVGRSFDVAIPIGTEPLLRREQSALDHRSYWWLAVMARLAPGETTAQANARLRAIQAPIRDATLPAQREEFLRRYLTDPFTFVPAPGGQSRLRGAYQQPLTAVLAIVGIVFLIACASIANMMTARASARRRDLTIRLALGASRFRIARQLLTESLLIAVAGAGLGVLLAQWGSRLVVSQLTTYADVVDLDLALDWRVLAFSIGLGALAAVLAGAAPALTVGRLGPQEALNESVKGVAGEARLGVRHASVILQVALSLTLIVAAGLFARSLTGLMTRDAGFDRHGVLVVVADTSRSAVPIARRADLFARFASAAATVPGVSAAAASYNTPVARGGWNTQIVVPSDSPLGRRERLSMVNAVTPGWFGTLGLRFAGGRDFSAHDNAGAVKVAIVNRAFERRFLNGRAVLGSIVRTVEPRGEPPEYEIVGIVEDAVYHSLRAPMEPTIYLPMAQSELRPSNVVSVRLAGGLSSQSVAAVAAAIEKEDPSVLLSFHSLEEQVNASLTQERIVATLAAFFGGLGLLLAAIGLYGLTAYAVTSRRAEIGVRMALGADAHTVVRLVLGRVAWLVGAGIVAGAALSAWAATFARTLLYGLDPRDPLTFAGAALVLIAVAWVAAWLPARRASRIDPVIALRT